MPKEHVEKVKQFLFPVVLSGWGGTPEEAWQDATDAFSQDPGVCPDDFSEEEEEF